MVVFHAEAGAITDPELAAGVAATVDLPGGIGRAA